MATKKISDKRIKAIIKELGLKTRHDKLSVILFLKGARSTAELSIPRPKVAKLARIAQKHGFYFDVEFLDIPVILAKKKKRLKRFHKIGQLAAKQRHREYGKFFGYPKCCIKAFGKPRPKGKAPQEFKYLLHVPHSLKCKSSLTLAKKYKKLAKDMLK